MVSTRESLPKRSMRKDPAALATVENLRVGLHNRLGTISALAVGFLAIPVVSFLSVALVSGQTALFGGGGVPTGVLAIVGLLIAVVLGVACAASVVRLLRRQPPVAETRLLMRVLQIAAIWLVVSIVTGQLIAPDA